MAGRYSKLLTLLFFFLSQYSYAAGTGPTIQINTHLDRIVGRPTWLIVVYDADSPAVYPYIFNIQRKDESFIIYTRANNYRMVSILQFDDSLQKINNFCDLPRGVIAQQSLTIYLTGAITRSRWSASCSVSKSSDMSYTTTS